MMMDGSASFHHVDVVLGSSDLPFDGIALSICHSCSLIEKTVWKNKMPLIEPIM